MKFYNPFKAHIVQTEEGFFIRKINFITLQCEYLEEGGDYWYNEANSHRCMFKGIDAARSALHQLKMKKLKNKQKYIES
jgi:hypothetical protein